MIKAATVVALLLLAFPAAPQVLTVGRDGRTRPSATLTAREKAVLLPALRDATGDASANLASFSVFQEPLSNTGTPAIVAISLKDCGAHHDCPFLVFRKAGSVEIPLLSSVAGDWDLKETRHHGYRDIALTNYEGVQKLVYIWRFDGHKYRVSACTDRTADGAPQSLPLSQCGP